MGKTQFLAAFEGTILVATNLLTNSINCGMNVLIRSVINHMKLAMPGLLYSIVSLMPDPRIANTIKEWSL